MAPDNSIVIENPAKMIGSTLEWVWRKQNFITLSMKQ